MAHGTEFHFVLILSEYELKAETDWINPRNINTHWESGADRLCVQQDSVGEFVAAIDHSKPDTGPSDFATNLFKNETSFVSSDFVMWATLP